MSAPGSATPADAARRGPNGAVLILVATAVGGGAGYLLQIVTGAALGTAAYAPFSVFWSALYLLVSALSGVQQEVARATHPDPVTVETSTRAPVVRNFALAASAIAAALVAATAWLWVGAVFPDAGWALVPQLVIGLAAYVIVAATAGVLYGLSLWTSVAALTIVDGLLRFAIVGGLLLVTDDTTLLAWGVAAPFVLTPLILWPFVRRGVVGRFGIDVGPTALSWNVLRTVVASAATGVMVSGLPLVIQATGDTVSANAFGSLTYAITLTRAPIVIVVLALQSYLVIVFRSHADAVLGWVLRMVVLVVVAAGVLGLLAWWLGPWALSVVFGRSDVLAGGTIGLLVATAGLVGALCVTGSATLSRSRHTAFAAGWIVAALAMVATLLLPLGLHERTLLALTVGPVAGLVVHVIALLRRRPITS
ncbi:hypothetical protein SAMN06295974_3332 [Plantibacter flavus]|uniref:O-antigen/teichoic acid export membrane protein n=1 Tax=Plantibacter flavus TaxID=150123 RepID=A0A3N2C4L4_9MICO|nr:hypothetical protein [Plantibacter flavus]ROR82436.1 hypothetical protein EDD42_2527 [Plantibacter flavus]SMG44188.1 hypothetical protein SAMN06295974_3332 [Plantibacter flavus]